MTTIRERQRIEAGEQLIESLRARKAAYIARDPSLWAEEIRACDIMITRIAARLPMTPLVTGLPSA